MSGRAWVSLLLIATLTGCASRSRPKPCLTRTAHWNALPAFDSTAWWSSEILGGLLPRVGSSWIEYAYHRWAMPPPI
jgi:hypothetical protein